MKKHLLYEHSLAHMKKLCVDISERCVGSKGNRQATEYFKNTLSSFGWTTLSQEFSAVDWFDGGASLKVDNTDIEVLVSPYSLGFSGSAELVKASDISGLKKGISKIRYYSCTGKSPRNSLCLKTLCFTTLRNTGK